MIDIKKNEDALVKCAKRIDLFEYC
jgi:hypothetical protein